MIVTQNFTGCIENLQFNSTNIVQLIKDVYDSGNEWGMQTYKKINVFDICPVIFKKINKFKKSLY